MPTGSLRWGCLRYTVEPTDYPGVGGRVDGANDKRAQNKEGPLAVVTAKRPTQSTMGSLTTPKYLFTWAGSDGRGEVIMHKIDQTDRNAQIVTKDARATRIGLESIAGFSLKSGSVSHSPLAYLDNAVTRRGLRNNRTVWPACL